MPKETVPAPTAPTETRQPTKKADGSVVTWDCVMARGEGSSETTRTIRIAGDLPNVNVARDEAEKQHAGERFIYAEAVNPKVRPTPAE